MTARTNKMGWVLLSAGLVLVVNTMMVTGGHWHKIAGWSSQQPVGSMTAESPPADTHNVIRLSPRLG